MYKKTVRLAGVTRGDEDRQKNIMIFGCKDIGSFALVREPNNPFDPNAIRITVAGVILLGYVPREVAKDLAPLMDSGRQFIAFFVNRNVHPLYKTIGLTVEIREMPEEEPGDRHDQSSPDMVAHVL
jgi:hypothetical protein